MFLNIDGRTQQYLANLSRIQNNQQTAQAEIGSGLRVARPSDDPNAIANILQTQAGIVTSGQIHTNLGVVKAEVDSADSALQQSIQDIENAISLASQAASTTTSVTGRAAIAQQVAGLQQSLVGISQTSVNGRYIFSGDQDNQAAYKLDDSQPTGVQRLLTAPATRTIQSVDGTSFAVAKTAGEIFDARNSDDSIATGNVFAAVNSLLTAINANDTAAMGQASDDLKAADTHLNNQLAFYGAVENKVQDATSLAQKFQTQQQSNLSQLRDADIPAMAAQLTQSQIQSQATLQVEASVAQAKNLFSFLA